MVHLSDFSLKNYYLLFMTLSYLYRTCAVPFPPILWVSPFSSNSRTVQSWFPITLCQGTDFKVLVMHYERLTLKLRTIVNFFKSFFKHGTIDILNTVEIKVVAKSYKDFFEFNPLSLWSHVNFGNPFPMTYSGGASLLDLLSDSATLSWTKFD